MSKVVVGLWQHIYLSLPHFSVFSSVYTPVTCFSFCLIAKESGSHNPKEALYEKYVASV